MKPAIVVIAYNRDDCLRRLLNSLNNASFGNAEDVTLVISIDKSDNTKVPLVANAFEWKHGTKEVIIREERLGLKKHVIECGGLSDKYDSIIVLEDDLFVSPDFYNYACAALSFVKDNDKVAGVSLYNHCLNVHVREPFEAIDDGYDNYYMQFAQSWGQAYTKEQWHGFTEWMKLNEYRPVEGDNIPDNVSSWSDKSWLKYYIKYIVDTDKYFIYPRVSYTTNFSDEGTHAKSAVTDLQVALASAKKREFLFSAIDESKAVYDAFFENMKIELSDEYKSATIDLYGYKKSASERFLLSSKSLPYSVVKSYGRVLRPVDANIVFDIEGKDLFLYDRNSSASAPSVNEALRILYNHKALNVKKMMEVIKYRVIKK